MIKFKEMKKMFVIYLLFFILAGCSNDNGNSQQEQTVKPIAVADFYSTNENAKLIISDLFKNDTTQDETELSSFDSTSTQKGKVIKNNDGTFSYIPANAFVGTDSFTYTICNGKSVSNCSTATVTIKVHKSSVSFKIPLNLGNYYEKLGLSANKETNKQNLKNIISDYKVLSYGSRHNYLYKADADLIEPNNVVLIYTGEKRFWKEYVSGSNSHSPQTFNTEHIYPRSKLISKNSGTDLHHLRACDTKINSNRGNFSFIEGNGKNKLIDGNKWYPGDEWKGDVARMIFYLNLVHGETFEKVGSLDLFLKWNIEDPVSDFEIQRNNEIYKAQKNRNPFIDNPYLITLIYGGEKAENKWE